MTPPLPKTKFTESTETPLRLKCPVCDGGLFLNQRDLGITGQCVHCQIPLTALGQPGSIRLVTGPAPHLNDSFNHPEPPDMSKRTPASSESTTVDWSFPLESAPGPDWSDSSSSPNPDLTNRNKLSDAIPSSAPVFRQSSLFRDYSAEADESISALFKNEDNSSQITPAWGTKILRENHSPISPFATGSAGGGFAESLFREKVTKESTGIAGARETTDDSITVDSDGQPANQLAKAQESNLAENLFLADKAQRRPGWMKKVLQTLLALVVLGTVGVGVFFSTPEEKLATWREKTYAWFEPGLAALDYVPEALRPNSLPQTNPGNADGANQKSEPEKTQNVFGGLKKLDDKIGRMRSPSEEGLKNINKL